MVGATASGVTVCCPECGGPLRVAFADGGSTVGCHRCGEAVRVPARPHPVETPADAPPLLPPAVARRAARGVRLLQLSLILFAAEHLLLAGVLAAWLAGAGPAGVAARALGDAGPLLAFAVGLDLGLALTRAGVRWVGYRRCEGAAAAVGAAGWVRWARWAPLLRVVGFVGAFAPWAAGVPVAAVPTWGQAAVTLALVAWTTGGVLEFSAVAAWGRLLAALGDRYAAGRAVRYAVGVVGGVLVVLVGVTLVRMIALRPGPDRRLQVNWVELPAEAVPAVVGLAVVACGVTAVLWVQYAQLLAALRGRLRDQG